MFVRLFFFFSVYLLIASSAQARAQPDILLPASGLVAKDLAIIVNQQDPLSVKIASYYQQQRKIPKENIITISFKTDTSVIHPGEFAVLQKTVESRTPKHIQAYLLTWADPYRVGCMSISSAFALGFDKKYCAKGCEPTVQTRYARSKSLRPYDDFGIRPSMLLAATSFNEAKALIDRGIAADGQAVLEGNRAAAYLVETTDKTRSVRKNIFPAVEMLLADQISVNRVKTNAIRNKTNIMFYFTGKKFVDDIESNQFLPGAMADHLTSTGGRLTNSTQMSALRWLEGGATGSYGTVVEPCNFLDKFPSPLIAMSNYLQGASLIEAYWKSVITPGQGVFIGEPLAKPYAGYQLNAKGKSYELYSPVLTDGYYKVSTASQQDGPFTLVTSGIEITPYNKLITLPLPMAAFYKIERLLGYAQPIF